MKIVISSGHGKYVRGASGYIDEVDQARRVVNRVAELLNAEGVQTTVFHDDVSTSQSENLNRIVNFHNSKSRDLDVSVHFNAYSTTSKPMGCEVLYVSSAGMEVADTVVDEICQAAGFINRGPKKRTDLAFLNGTEEVAILIETCFVDSKADVDIYNAQFENICMAIAETIGEVEIGGEPVPPPTQDEDDELIASLAAKSAIASYEWRDRGRAPEGYIKGFALTWAAVVRRFLDNDPTVLEMAEGSSHNDEIDALAWFNAEFQQIGMSNEVSGLDTLRHLYVLLLGLGMRESSGRHCEGRDMSADNIQSDTAEAGLYQTSYNAHTCSVNFDELMERYEDGEHNGYKEYFQQGVECSSSDWSNYGSGDGAKFQRMCKELPAFAVETAALTLRNRRQHYGPVNRKEVELRHEADWLLLNVQRYVTHEGSGEA